MPKVTIDVFGGLRPRYQRRMGSAGWASKAENVDLSGGSLRPIRQPQLVATAEGCISSMAIFGCDILTDENPCASFASGVGHCHRLFATGLCDFDYPVTARYEPGCSLGVVSPDWVRLGLVQPEAVSFTVPALAPPIAPPSIVQGNQPKREHRDYVITYVNSFGEESAPSLGSPDAQDADNDASAIITIGPRPDPSDGWDIVAIRIYRMMTGNTSGDYPTEEPVYLFVEELSLEGISWDSPITFNDEIPASELAEPAPLECVQPPPANLRGLIELKTGALAGYVGKQLWISQPFEYHNWPCWLDLESCIRGIKEVDNTIYVLTDGKPYIVSSAPPEGDCMCCRSVKEINEPAPLVADQRAIGETPNGVVYPSNDGLVRLTGEGMSLITHSEIDEYTWRSFYPSTIKGATLNGQYLGFGRVAFNFDYTDGVYSDGDVGAPSRLTTYSYNVDAVALDQGGRLFIAMGDSVYQWEESPDFEVFTWRSRIIQSHARWNWSAARVFAGDGGGMVTITSPITFSFLDGAGKVFHTVRVIDENPFRLPPGIRDRAVEIELRGTSEVQGVSVATSIRELAETSQ